MLFRSKRIQVSPAVAAANRAFADESARRAIFEPEPRQRSSEQLVQKYTREAEAVDSLAAKYSKLSIEQRRAEEIRLRAARESGQRVSIQTRAMEAVNDPYSDFNRSGGRGGAMHAFRYGSQNAAFALEDYMIASQYGGPKAGMRAITNNLTDRKSTRLNSSHVSESRMPSSA